MNHAMLANTKIKHYVSLIYETKGISLAHKEKSSFFMSHFEFFKFSTLCFIYYFLLDLQ